jgi:hypothetical protein
MVSPHPFTVINPGDLVSITGWAPVSGYYGTICSLPIHGFTPEQYLTNEEQYFFTLSHAETVVGLVVDKYKKKQKEFILVLVNDITVRIERGWVHSANFCLGKISRKKK